MIIKSGKSKYSLIEKLGILINHEVEADFNQLIPEDLTVEEENQIIEQLEKEPNDQEIDERLSNISNLVLTVTENCNLRCRYCAYSGAYIGERIHSTQRLAFKTAQHALRLYFKYINNQNRQITLNRLPIGFYGGEPLLELELLKNIVEYARTIAFDWGLDRKFTFFFAMTTNGLLLNDRAVDFLVQNNFYVSVSLDGPKECHDKFRVTSNNQGSWEKVMGNLQRFESRYPNFYKEKVNFLCTMHPFYDGEAIDNFFLSHKELFKMENIKFSSLKMNSLEQSLRDILEEERNKHSSSRLRFEKAIAQNFNPKKFKINMLRPGIKFTGTCFPGEKKFFIGVDGCIHICESMSPIFSLGNVFDGINYDALRRTLMNYNKGILKMKCWKCEVWFLCNTCFASSVNGKEIDIYCPKSDIITSLTDFLSYKEYEHEKDRANYCVNSAVDYLEFLQ